MGVIVETEGKQTQELAIYGGNKKFEAIMQT